MFSSRKAWFSWWWRNTNWKKVVCRWKSMIKNETEQDVVAPGAIEPFFQPELRKLSFWKDFIAFNQKIQNKAQSVRSRSIPRRWAGVLDSYLVDSSFICKTRRVWCRKRWKITKNRLWFVMRKRKYRNIRLEKAGKRPYGIHPPPSCRNRCRLGA